MRFHLVLTSDFDQVYDFIDFQVFSGLLLYSVHLFIVFPPCFVSLLPTPSPFRLSCKATFFFILSQIEEQCKERKDQRRYKKKSCVIDIIAVQNDRYFTRSQLRVGILFNTAVYTIAAQIRWKMPGGNCYSSYVGLQFCYENSQQTFIYSKVYFRRWSLVHQQLLRLNSLSRSLNLTFLPYFF